MENQIYVNPFLNIIPLYKHAFRFWVVVSAQLRRLPRPNGILDIYTYIKLNGKDISGFAVHCFKANRFENSAAAGNFIDNSFMQGVYSNRWRVFFYCQDCQPDRLPIFGHRYGILL